MQVFDNQTTGMHWQTHKVGAHHYRLNNENSSTHFEVAVALGGFGSIIGCLYAGIIIGLVESLGGLLIDPSFKLLYVFVIYLLVVIYKPQGLFGRY